MTILLAIGEQNEAEQNAENDLNYDLDVEIDDILLNQIHPALDDEAKWNINDIFVDNLGRTPNYI